MRLQLGKAVAPQPGVQFRPLRLPAASGQDRDGRRIETRQQPGQVCKVHLRQQGRRTAELQAGGAKLEGLPDRLLRPGQQRQGQIGPAAYDNCDLPFLDAEIDVFHGILL